jgi:hypothetical protein
MANKPADDWLDAYDSRWQRVRIRRIVPTYTHTRTRKILPVGLLVPACG